MTHQAPNPGDAAWDPMDPHGFHKDADGRDAHHQHHVSSWQLQVIVLAALLFFTFFTVAVASAEVWVTTYLDIHITQLWNVIIAMAIATVKAMLVCMYFMHLRHDNPLNTYIMLFTLLTLGLFLAFPAIDTGSRGFVNEERATVLWIGGTGQGLERKDGRNVSMQIVYQARQEKIELKGLVHRVKGLMKSSGEGAGAALTAGETELISEVSDKLASDPDLLSGSDEANGRLEKVVKDWQKSAVKKIADPTSGFTADDMPVLSEDDLAYGAEYVWFHFYDYKAEKAHGKPIKQAYDDKDGWLEKWKLAGVGHGHGAHGEDHGSADADGQNPQAVNRSVVRTGLTPGLFADDHAEEHESEGP